VISCEGANGASYKLAAVFFYKVKFKTETRKFAPS